eukprot:COSAG06_NODE_47_length_29196_cov_53.194178_3_plen_188_part_00
MKRLRSRSLDLGLLAAPGANARNSEAICPGIRSVCGRQAKAQARTRLLSRVPSRASSGVSLPWERSFWFLTCAELRSVWVKAGTKRRPPQFARAPQAERVRSRVRTRDRGTVLPRPCRANEATIYRSIRMQGAHALARRTATYHIIMYSVSLDLSGRHTYMYIPCQAYNIDCMPGIQYIYLEYRTLS